MFLNDYEAKSLFEMHDWHVIFIVVDISILKTLNTF